MDGPYPCTESDSETADVGVPEVGARQIGPYALHGFNHWVCTPLEKILRAPMRGSVCKAC